MITSHHSPHRLAALQSALSLQPHTALLIFTPELITYFLDLKFIPSPAELTFFISNRHQLLFHTPLIDPQQSGFPHDHIDYICLKSKDIFTLTLSQVLDSTTRFLYCDSTTPHSVAVKIHKLFPHLKLKDSAKFIDPLIQEKNALERRHLKKAGQIASHTMDRAISQLKPGITELQLSHFINLHLLSFGAESSAFEPIVAFGNHTAIPHHHPTNKKFRSSYPVLIDLGARYQLFCSDMTRTILPSSCSSQLRQIHSIVFHAYQAAVTTLTTSQSYSDVDQAARVIIDKAGFSLNFFHSTGHGLGIGIHESPTINSNSTDYIKPHQAITIEPGVYLPGKFGVRYENTLLTTNRQPLVLTRSRFLN